MNLFINFDHKNLNNYQSMFQGFQDGAELFLN